MALMLAIIILCLFWSQLLYELVGREISSGHGDVHRVPTLKNHIGTGWISPWAVDNSVPTTSYHALMVEAAIVREPTS
ncbi:hypothetical protein RvY_02072 [Ramazzottius varieornatus]|uniref:Uncharacterized protein n=1 Tax=Ramazzottius varieornatus TaxID=947166 RepID=A0A1D1UII6_RAMVA|nr:hypothetical protein RvY_02072 [Ramazzottius varieornatus]